MVGKTHKVLGAACGAVSGGLVGAAMRDPLAAVTILALSIAFSCGPDVDHKPAPTGRRWPLVRWIVNLMSWCFGLDKHRGITHTVVFMILVGVLAAWGMTALTAPPQWAAVVGIGVSTGWGSHLIGDRQTRSSLPDLWWPFARDALAPRWRFFTGGKMERMIIYPILVAVTCGAIVFMFWAVSPTS
jgi:membrane-bound metal-dependent hydrolase YbcI (DUF457 family)